MAKRIRIPEGVALFIVEQLASFETPSTVAAAVKKEFSLDITRQAVEAYNPTRVIGKDLSAKLREHFFKTREAFRRQIDEIPISSRAVRLRALDRMAVRFEEMGNLFGAARILEQAAKEMGGMYVSRADLGAPVETRPAGPQPTGADHLARLGDRYAKGLMLVQGGKQ